MFNYVIYRDRISDTGHKLLNVFFKFVTHLNNLYIYIYITSLRIISKRIKLTWTSSTILNNFNPDRYLLILKYGNHSLWILEYT